MRNVLHQLGLAKQPASASYAWFNRWQPTEFVLAEMYGDHPSLIYLT